jgi:large conductance mechanosensitive channel
MKGFIEFIREQGVVGLAIGLVLGGAVTKVVTATINDFITPILGLLLGSTKGLGNVYFKFFGAKILYGHFLTVLIDFVVIAALIYFIVKGMKLDKIDKPKEKIIQPKKKS